MCYTSNTDWYYSDKPDALAANCLSLPLAICKCLGFDKRQGLCNIYNLLDGMRTILCTTKWMLKYSLTCIDY